MPKPLFSFIKLFFFLVIFLFLGLILPNSASAATLTLTPSTAVAGQEVIVTGATFDNSSLVTFTWDGSPLTTVPASVTTSGSGAIPLSGQVSFTVPSGSLGSHIVRASTSASVFGIATFTISTPGVTITSPSAPSAGYQVGIPLVVTATNLEANKLVSFYFDNTVVATGTSTIAGTSEVSFVVPDVANTGAHVIKASNSTYAIAVITITVALPTLTTTPSTTIPNTIITLSGTNFKISSPVSFLINDQVLSTDPVTTNGAGSFAVQVTVPDLAPGTNIIKAYSYSNLYSTTTLTISTPILTISPITGPDGLIIYASGTNFKASATVNFFINNEALSTTTTTNTIGAFGVSLTVPKNTSAGVSTIRAQTSNVTFSNATYTVTTATITLSPTTGVAGTRVVITGSNFNSSGTVSITWNGKTTITPVDGTTLVNPQGGFVAYIIIPDNYVPGANQIVVSSSSDNTAIATFTVAVPTIVTSPVSGTASGTKIVLTGTNFEGNKTVNVYWDDQVIATVPSRVTSTSLGSFYLTITAPNGVRGTHYIKASTSSNVYALYAYALSSPVITLSRTSGQSNSKVVLSGSGFNTNALITFTWDNSTNIISDPIEIMTDSIGSFLAQITIPAGATQGDHILVAKTSADVYINTTFTVTKGTIVLSSSSGSPLTKVLITGSNFDADSTITFYWDGKLIEKTESNTDSIGGFSEYILIPLSKPGTHTLRAETSKFTTALSDYIVKSPSITIQPEKATIGQEVVITGSGFPANTKLDLSVDGFLIKNGTQDYLTDDSGSFIAKFKIPFTLGDFVSVTASTGDTSKASLNFSLAFSDLYINFMLLVKILISTAFVILIFFIVNKLFLKDKIVFFKKKEVIQVPT